MTVVRRDALSTATRWLCTNFGLFSCLFIRLAVSRVEWKNWKTDCQVNRWERLDRTEFGCVQWLRFSFKSWSAWTDSSERSLPDDKTEIIKIDFYGGRGRKNNFTLIGNLWPTSRCGLSNHLSRQSLNYSGPLILEIDSTVTFVKQSRIWK